jgi:hypothetical protein
VNNVRGCYYYPIVRDDLTPLSDRNTPIDAGYGSLNVGGFDRLLPAELLLSGESSQGVDCEDSGIWFCLQVFQCGKVKDQSLPGGGSCSEQDIFLLRDVADCVSLMGVNFWILF